MKQAALFTFCVATVVCYDSNAMAELTSVPSLIVHLGLARTVFVKPEAGSQSLEITKRKFLQSDFVLDAKAREKGEAIWCKRVAGESYKDIFRQKDVSVKKLGSLKKASISELTGLLGEPVFMEGPMDSEGTMLYKWRTFNGERGDRMIALEAAAGFKGGSPTNVLFLLLSVAKSN